MTKYELEVESLLYIFFQEKKKFEEKLKLNAKNFKLSEEIYSNLKHVFIRNIEEIDEKAYNKAQKELLQEKML